ncbi:hypothetical protein POUND7_006997, partial [Theobroma cacao]
MARQLQADPIYNRPGVPCGRGDPYNRMCVPHVKPSPPKCTIYNRRGCSPLASVPSLWRESHGELL